MKHLGYHGSFIGIFVLLCCSLLLAVKPASAQLRDGLNLPDHDSKPYYLGIGFMYEQSHLQVSAHPKFLQSDSILSVTPGNTGGFGVSGMFTFKLANHLEFRFAFPEGMAFIHILGGCGYTRSRMRRLSLGICSLYIGEKQL